jgi:hypothetical protein
MSNETFQQVVSLAATDRTFRDALKSQPEAVLAGRGLTAEEIAALKAMQWDADPATGRELEQRTSRFVFRP